MEDEKQFLGFEMIDPDPNMWKKMQAALLKAMQAVGDTTIDPIDNTTVSDELKIFAHHGINYAKAKLAKPALDNNKTIAEVEDLYASKELKLAEVRKLNAETREKNANAQKTELENMKLAMQLMMEMKKLQMLVSPEQKVALVGKNMIDYTGGIENGMV